ncbi:MAG: DNA-directed RNA polymerase subunit P [Candidatus Pacearchaeota archaeon]
MAQYKCFRCSKTITNKVLDKRFNCPHCNSKIFYKPRTHVVKIKAL